MIEQRGYQTPPVEIIQREGFTVSSFYTFRGEGELTYYMPDAHVFPEDYEIVFLGFSPSNRGKIGLAQALGDYLIFNPRSIEFIFAEPDELDAFNSGKYGFGWKALQTNLEHGRVGLVRRREVLPH